MGRLQRYFGALTVLLLLHGCRRVDGQAGMSLMSARLSMMDGDVDPVLMDILLHPEFFPVPQPGGIEKVVITGPTDLSGTYTTNTKFINQCAIPSDCKVTLNSTVTLKDAFFVFQNVHVVGSSIPTDGAALKVLGKAYVEVVNCSFTGLQGYGVMALDGFNVNATFYNTVFADNACDVHRNDCAGAIYGSSGSRLYLFDTVFRNNSALNLGGAVHLDTGARAYLTRVAFEGNSVLEAPDGSREAPISKGGSRKRGGAIAINGASAYGVFFDCDFRGNIAPQEGGAVALWDYAESLFVRCDFIGNRAWHGGAVFAGSEGSSGIAVRTQAWFYSSWFTSNHAAQPSPPFMASVALDDEEEEDDDEERGSDVIGNGSALFVLASKVFATNCTFSDHGLDGAGHNGTVSVESSQFTEDALINLYNVTFINNTALDGGCVHAKRRAVVSATSVRFEHCNALRAGGAMFIHDRSILHAAATHCVNSSAGGHSAAAAALLPEEASSPGLSQLLDGTVETSGGCLHVSDGSDATVSAAVSLGMAQGMQQESSMIEELVEGTGFAAADVAQTLQGALGVYSDLSSRPAVFDSCTADLGAAIEAVNSKVSVSGAIFSGAVDSPLEPGESAAQGSSVHARGTELFITLSEFIDSGAGSTVHTEGEGSLLLTNSLLVDTLPNATAAEALVHVASGPAVLDNVTFTPEESQRVMLETPPSNAPRVYADPSEVPLREPDLETTTAWASCYTLAVQSVSNGTVGATSCGHILSPVSDISIVTSTVPIGVPDVVELGTPGQQGDCAVGPEQQREILDLGDPLLLEYVCGAQDVPPPPESNVTNAAVVSCALAITFVIFAVVMFVFWMTPGDAILDNTMYKQNLVNIKNEKPDEFLEALSSINGALGKAGEAAYKAWCTIVLTMAYCLMCMWSDMRAKDKTSRLK